MSSVLLVKERETMNPYALFKALLHYAGTTTIGGLSGFAMFQAFPWEHPLVISALTGLIGSALAVILKTAIEWHRTDQKQSITLIQIAQRDKEQYVTTLAQQVGEMRNIYETQIAFERANRHDVVNELHQLKSILFAVQAGADIKTALGVRDSLVLFDVASERERIKELQGGGDAKGI